MDVDGQLSPLPGIGNGNTQVSPRFLYMFIEDVRQILEQLQALPRVQV